MRIKSWRKFFESVEESLEDIKSMLGDIDERLTMIFKKWLLETYNIKADYIHLV